MNSPIVYGVPWVGRIGLVSKADTTELQVNPTIAAGDFQVSKDGGSFVNLATLPTVEPAGSEVVKLSLSAADMQADDVVIRAKDQAGNEWCTLLIDLQPTRLMVPGTVDNAGFTPTQTEFECSDITEATANHYVGRTLHPTSGNLVGQSTTITAYSLVGGRGHFTVRQMTEAFSNGDTFVIA